MDPVTHGVFGSLWALPTARRENMRRAAVAGWLGAMAPDLDVLIRSAEDTLLYIEYHRQFTHSLIFIPIGALAVALVLWPFFRRHTRFASLYLWCFLGYASHGFLDACTSYGTQMLWPFSDARIAWNWISVVDLVYTLPLLFLTGWAVWRRRHRAVALAWVWLVLYMALGAVQHSRAAEMLDQWAADRDITVERAVTKPAFANIVLWRGLIDDGEQIHLVAIRNLPGGEERTWSGGSIERFDPGRFDPETRLGEDLRRFDHFSSGWLARFDEYEKKGQWFAGDVRYAIDPASQRPLWGVRFDPDEPDGPARYTTPRLVVEEERSAFFDRLFNRIDD